MASKRRLRRVKCLKKRSYPSHEIALQIAGIVSKKYNDKVHAYVCTFCHQWHIGHMPKRMEEAMRERKFTKRYL